MGVALASHEFAANFRRLFAHRTKSAPERTLGLVMISSDATLLTNISGDKSSHCVYMSCGNIRKEVRSKASARCWMKIAEIPKATFEEISSQRVLKQRLYHTCMDIVTESLKHCSHAPVRMTDANGDERLVRTILFVHLADLPEQLLISCCHGGASPISYARHSDFGTGVKMPPRTGVSTLEAIRGLKVEPSNIARYESAAGKMGLNGVFEPFWRDWKFADPQQIFGDALHQWHKFFGEHILKWARKLLGDKEIDRGTCACRNTFNITTSPMASHPLVSTLVESIGS